MATALARDGSGNVYVTGAAESANFPVSSGAFQTTIRARQNAFVAKLNLGPSSTDPSFTVTATPVTIEPGATTGNTSTITLTPADGFTGSVALTAAVTSSPNGAQNPGNLISFSFGSTSPVSITGAAAGTATLTITTWATGSCAQTYQTPHGFFWYTGGGAALGCLLLFGIPARRRRWRLALAMWVLLAALMGGFLACGSSRIVDCPTTQGTPTGTYTITVTGTSGATTATGAFTLTVQ
jgi:hypothetical protein